MVFPLCEFLSVFWNQKITTGLTLVCKQRDDEELNTFPHNEQGNGFSPVCTLICITKVEFWLNDLVQNGHLKGFSSVLTLQIWLLRIAWIADSHNCLLVLQVVGMITRPLLCYSFFFPVIHLYISVIFSLQLMKSKIHLCTSAVEKRNMLR
jgi:hypothetical protein